MKKSKASKIMFAVVVLLAGLYGLAYMTTSSSLLSRILVWRDADVDDYLRFPARTIANAPPRFNFSRPESQGAFFEKLNQHAQLPKNAVGADLAEFLAKTQTMAFLILRNDTLLTEEYFNGYNAESICTSFSIAKSITSVLVGVALEEGRIKSLEDPVTNYIPELLEQDARFQEITLHHLVTMSSGLQYVKSDNPFVSDDPKTYYDPDLRARALQAVVEGAPGEKFRYNNYNPLLVGMVIERATGKSVSEYLSEKIWQPLGMSAPATWSLDSEASGFEKMESGVNARAIDFLKFGRLFLHEGNWNGRQIIPADWVYASTKPDSLNDPARFYQYFWWVNRSREPDYHYYGEGNKGQFIYIVPSSKIIIARFGVEYGHARWPAYLAYLADEISKL